MKESEKVLATKHKSNTGKNEEKGPAMLRKMKTKMEKVKCKKKKNTKTISQEWSLKITMCPVQHISKSHT